MHAAGQGRNGRIAYGSGLGAAASTLLSASGRFERAEYAVSAVSVPGQGSVPCQGIVLCPWPGQAAGHAVLAAC